MILYLGANNNIVELILNALFVLGVIAQVAILLKGKKNRLLAAMIILSLILTGAYALSMVSKGVVAEGLLNIFFLSFSFLSAIMFREEILPEINEGTLFIFTVVFWFISLAFLNRFLCLPFYIIPVACTIGTIWLAITETKLEGNAQAFFYAWFMFMTLVIGLLQFSVNFLPSLFNLDGAMPDPISAFFAGMSFFWLFAYGFYLYDLIPIPGKRQTMDDRLKEWREFLDLLNSKYSDSQMKPIMAVLVILICSGLLIINFIFNLVNDFLLISLLVVLCQLFPLAKSGERQMLMKPDYTPSYGLKKA